MLSNINHSCLIILKINILYVHNTVNYLAASSEVPNNANWIDNKSIVE